MPCAAVTTAFLLLAALCIQDTTAFTNDDCEYFHLNVDNKGWHSVVNTMKKLKIVTTPLKYVDARNVCKNMNGDLFSIYTNQAHDDAMCWLHKYHNDMRVWIGGIREGTSFKWLEKGGPVIYNWVMGQPDNVDTKCLEMNWNGMGLYNDDDCNEKKPFICQYVLI